MTSNDTGREVQLACRATLRSDPLAAVTGTTRSAPAGKTLQQCVNMWAVLETI